MSFFYMSQAQIHSHSLHSLIYNTAQNFKNGSIVKLYYYCSFSEIRHHLNIIVKSLPFYSTKLSSYSFFHKTGLEKPIFGSTGKFLKVELMREPKPDLDNDIEHLYMPFIQFPIFEDLNEDQTRFR